MGFTVTGYTFLFTLSDVSRLSSYPQYFWEAIRSHQTSNHIIQINLLSREKQ